MANIRCWRSAKGISVTCMCKLLARNLNFQKWIIKINFTFLYIKFCLFFYPKILAHQKMWSKKNKNLWKMSNHTFSFKAIRMECRVPSQSSFYLHGCWWKRCQWSIDCPVFKCSDGRCNFWRISFRLSCWQHWPKANSNRFVCFSLFRANCRVISLRLTSAHCDGKHFLGFVRCRTFTAVIGALLHNWQRVWRLHGGEHGAPCGGSSQRESAPPRHRLQWMAGRNGSLFFH